jgi:lipid-binding SYLF domain-containing protein
MVQMRLRIAVLAALIATTISFAKDKKEKTGQRLDEAVVTISEIMGTPDKGIPQDLLDRAECMVIVPGLKKGAFILGGKYGKGFVSCRKPGGQGWTGPAAIRVEGGSVGLQIGGSETDVVMLIMNQRGMQKLMSSKFTLGGEGDVAAGPVGRNATAQTDAFMRAEILSWSRSRGVFAGVSLTGATLREDTEDNQQLYGKPYQNKQILSGSVPAPEPAAKLISLLDKYSARKTG